MDIGNIIYIIAIIIYFIYTIVKKGKKQEEIDRQPQGDDGAEQRRPGKSTAFDDLLREIRDAQKGTGQPTRHPQAEEETFEKTTPATAHTTERMDRPYQSQPIKQEQAYERFQGEVSDRQMPKLKTLDEQVKLSADIEGLKSSLEVETLDKEKKENRYSTLLKNPSTVKDAVILSEILHRKHF